MLGLYLIHSLTLYAKNYTGIANRICYDRSYHIVHSMLIKGDADTNYNNYYIHYDGVTHDE